MIRNTLLAAAASATVVAITFGVMGTPTALAQGTAVEFNTNRPGSDYRNFTLQTPDYRLCKIACGGDRRCKAWTYVKPGIQWSPTAPARCWLKTAVPRAGKSNCCVSGIKSVGGFSWHYAGYKVWKNYFRVDGPNGTYNVQSNRGSNIIRTMTKLHGKVLEKLQWVVKLEGMPGKLVVGQAARIQLTGEVLGYLKGRKSAENMYGYLKCVGGCQIVHKGTGKGMKAWALNNRIKKFDFELEIVPPAQRPTKLPTFPLVIEFGNRFTKTTFTYLPG